MAWVQNSGVNTSIKDNPGWCLRMTQSILGAPKAHPSAKAAYNATGQKYPTRDMPNVAVPVWFSWVGDLGDGQGRVDWGHSAVWIPSRGQFLSSPLSWSQGYGQSWVNSLSDFERILGCRYLGFTADINGLQVATYTADSKPAAVPAGGDVSALADGVLAGNFGNGQDRIDALGANYDAVQAEVNRRLSAPAPAPAPVSVTTYTVVAGDTLWGIATKYYGDGARYPEIAAANGVANPNLIFPGQVFTIPGV
jgi:hypothetical protein